jgi:hypothetical protein
MLRAPVMKFFPKMKTVGLKFRTRGSLISGIILLIKLVAFDYEPPFMV